MGNFSSHTVGNCSENLFARRSAESFSENLYLSYFGKLCEKLWETLLGICTRHTVGNFASQTLGNFTGRIVGNSSGKLWYSYCGEL